MSDDRFDEDIDEMSPVLGDDDTEGHAYRREARPPLEGDEEDVEGHGRMSREAPDEEDDVEGHRRNFRH